MSITSEINYTLRVHGVDVYGLFVPIVTNGEGKKLGKSQTGNVWLNPHKSSPFELYQYFVKLPDSVVEK